MDDLGNGDGEKPRSLREAHRVLLKPAADAAGTPQRRPRRSRQFRVGVKSLEWWYQLRLRLPRRWPPFQILE